MRFDRKYQDTERIVLFASNFNSRIQKCEVMSADGTFRSAQNNYKLLDIHAFYLTRCIH